MPLGYDEIRLDQGARRGPALGERCWSGAAPGGRWPLRRSLLAGQVTYVPAYLGDRGARSATRLRRDPPRPGAVGEGPCGSLTSPGLASARPQGRGEPARLEVWVTSSLSRVKGERNHPFVHRSDPRATVADRGYRSSGGLRVVVTGVITGLRVVMTGVIATNVLGVSMRMPGASV